MTTDMRRVNQQLQLLLVFSIILIAIGCSPNPIGFGVVLWPPSESQLDSGQVVPVFEQSELQGTYRVRLDDTDIDVATWRIAFFDSEPGAREYAREYQPYKDQYAQALRTALPIRENADRTSTRVYRLRDGEIVKVIQRQDEQSDEAGLVDYWYQVLTQNGTVGWVFGYYLDPADASGRSLTPQDDASVADRMVREIESQVWRPDYFRSMIDSQRIDLNRVRPEYRFVLDTENQLIKITLPTHTREIQYTDYYSPTDDTLEFQPVGVTIFLFGSDEIRVQYNVGGQQTTSTFITIQEDINELIATERQRRRTVLNSFLSRGNILVSTAYGTLEIDEESTFVWEGFERLIPQILPTGFSGTGSIEFSLFLEPDLRARYDGALRLVPSGGPGRAPAFLYRLSEEGIRMVYVPESQIEDNVVEEEPLSPVILFYRFVSS